MDHRAKILSLCTLVFLCIPLRSPPEPKVHSQIEEVVGSCGEPCIIKRNEGGKVGTFLMAAIDVRRGRRNLLIIDGECISACAILADFARPKVCITSKAVFKFHELRYKDADEYGNAIYRDGGPPPQSHDIDLWVWSQPRQYPWEEFTVMSFEQAKRFWPVCNKDTPLPRPDPRKATAAK